MKTVGILISQLNKGGAERVVAILSELLSDHYNVYLILFEDTYIKYKYNGKMLNLNTPSSKSIFLKVLSNMIRTIKLSKIKKKYKIDVLISFLDSPNILNVMTKSKNCKSIVSIRNYTEDELGNSKTKFIKKFVIKNFMKRADKVVCVSEAIRNLYHSDYKISPDKLCVIYNPYDNNHIYKLAHNKSQDNGFEKNENSIIFITIGRQMYQKGYWHLIKAFKIAYDVNPNIKLVMIGNDYCNNKVNELIDAYNMSESIINLGYKDNPYEYLKIADIYVLSSLFEGFPNAMVEAMVCNCAIIATDCNSGPREILYEIPNFSEEIEKVEFADYGILVPKLDNLENWDPHFVTSGEKVLAQAIITLSKDDILRSKYQELSFERSKIYDYGNFLKSFIAAIEN